MTTALLIAILNATPALLMALEKLFASFRAGGHTDTMPHTPMQAAQISALVAQHDPLYLSTISNTFASGEQTWTNPDGGE